MKTFMQHVNRYFCKNNTRRKGVFIEIFFVFFFPQKTKILVIRIMSNIRNSKKFIFIQNLMGNSQKRLSLELTIQKLRFFVSSLPKKNCMFTFKCMCMIKMCSETRDKRRISKLKAGYWMISIFQLLSFLHLKVINNNKIHVSLLPVKFVLKGYYLL